MSNFLMMNLKTLLKLNVSKMFPIVGIVTFAVNLHT